MVGFGIVIPVLPLYAERFGASPFTTGMLLAVYSGMGFIFSPIVGVLSDRLGRRSILLLSTIGQATGFFIMGAANSLHWLFVARTTIVRDTCAVKGSFAFGTFGLTGPIGLDSDWT